MKGYVVIERGARQSKPIGCVLDSEAKAFKLATAFYEVWPWRTFAVLSIAEWADEIAVRS